MTSGRCRRRRRVTWRWPARASPNGSPLPDDPDDAAWAHLLAEAARWAAHDRDDVLFDGADGTALLSDAELDARRGRHRSGSADLTVDARPWGRNDSPLHG